MLYRNAKGRVAHECIVDPRPLKATSGVTVDDIAKRLIDYGFHAPTMSFPVPGTLMIEPTESESKAELDRFCDAMIAIRNEIAEIEKGRWKVEASPLRHAPHTVHDIADDAWARAYSRAEGCFPAGTSRTDKYWSPVGRVDNVYGDRNLVCSCPPVADYAQAAEYGSVGWVERSETHHWSSPRVRHDDGFRFRSTHPTVYGAPLWLHQRRIPAPQIVVGQVRAAPPAVDWVVPAEIFLVGDERPCRIR